MSWGSFVWILGQTIHQFSHLNTTTGPPVGGPILCPLRCLVPRFLVQQDSEIIPSVLGDGRVQLLKLLGNPLVYGEFLLVRHSFPLGSISF